MQKKTNHFDYIYVRYLQNFKLKKRRFNCDEEKEKNFFPETCVTYIVYSFFSILISRCFVVDTLDWGFDSIFRSIDICIN